MNMRTDRLRERHWRWPGMGECAQRVAAGALHPAGMRGVIALLSFCALSAQAQLVATVEVTPESIVTNVCDPSTFDATGLFTASGEVTCDGADIGGILLGPFTSRSKNTITVTYMMYGAGPFGGTDIDIDDGTVTLITGCSQQCGPGNPDPPPGGPGSINFKIGLGNDASGYSAGWVWLHADDPGPSNATPGALQLLTGGASLDEVRDPNGVLLQVKAPECLANITVVNEFKYEVAFYYSADVSLNSNNCYTWGSAAPFTVYTIENPAASTNNYDTIRITQVKDATPSIYEYEYRGGKTWALKTGNGLREVIAAESIPTASVWTVTRTVKDESGAVVSKRRTTYQRMYRGEMLLPDTDSLKPVIQRRYYTTGGPNDTVYTYQYISDDCGNTSGYMSGHSQQDLASYRWATGTNYVLQQLGLPPNVKRVVKYTNTVWNIPMRVVDAGFTDVEIETVEDPDGLALVTRRTYSEGTLTGVANISGQLLVGNTFEPWAWNGGPLVSIPGIGLWSNFTFTCNGYWAGAFGKPDTIEYPDGRWEYYAYDIYGRPVRKTTSWLDAPKTAGPAQARSLEYNYQPVDPGDSLSAGSGVIPWPEVSPYSARTVTETILGNVVSRTFYAFYVNPLGQRVEIEERAASAEAAYGATGNLRTTRLYYANDDNAAGKLKTVTYPDGRLESHTYESGSFQPNADPAQCGFAPGWGDDLRETIVKGTTANPDGIANKTSKEVVVRNAAGREIMRETHAYTGGANYSRIAWTVTVLDGLGQPTAVWQSNGAHTEAGWACCGKEWESDEAGVETSYSYDALKRVTQKVKHGIAQGAYPAQPDQITTYTYDAEGRRLSEVLSAGLSQGQTNQYDLAGRLIESTDFAGRRTTTAYSQDGLTTTEILPGGFTRITERFKDGQVKTITGTAQVNQFYEYGINADGTKWIKVSTAAAGSPVWVKTTTDLLDRTAKVERPGYSTTEVTENFYNNKNQLVKQSTVHGSQFTVTLFAYDELGNQIRSGLDINGNGSLDLGGMDRISETETSYNLISGIWYLESVSKLYDTDNSAAVITNSITRQRRTGFAANTIAETISVDSLGNQTVSTTTIDRAAKRVTQTTDVPDSSANIVSISVNGLIQSQTSKSGITTTYSYDGLGRPTRSETVGGTRSVASVAHYDSRGWVDYVEDAAGHRTTYAYETATGRKTAQTDPLTNITYFSYSSYGLLEKTWGSASYPVAYEYDAYGRMTKMNTYRDGSGWSGSTWPASPGAADTTEWIYHEPSGLLLAKKDAAGKSVSYTYTGNSKLETRNWARTDGTNSLVTTYTYNSAGDLTAIDYSGSTPDVSFTYDRLGRQKTAESSVSSHAFAYNGLLLDTETIISSAGTNVIDRFYDTLGRSAGFTLGYDYSISYGYDSLGRFAAITSSVSSASICGEYSYLPNSDLLSGLTSVVGPLSSVSTRSYEDHRNLLTQIKNSVDTQTISQFDYANDALGRRTSTKHSGSAFSTGPAFNKYDYNSRSEVIVGDKFWGTDINDTGDPVAGQGFAYAYDNIGNRTTSSRDNEESIYTANSLNQYLQRTIPDGFDILGSAETGTTVTVNNSAVNRHNTYWHKLSRVDNTGVAAYPEVEIVGVSNPAGTNEPDTVAAETGRVFVAKTPEQYTYDADGNQLQDGRFNYTWDGENRLIGVETRTGALPGNVPRIKVEFAYDYMSRRISKKVYARDSGSWLLTSVSSFLYDAWNLIREDTTAAGTGKIVDEYIWGLDLSGSLQGAGGVGGLLSRHRSVERYYDGQGKLIICHHPPRNPEQPKTIRINENKWPLHEAHGDTLGACEGPNVTNSTFFYTYDGNGNVSELLQSSVVGPPSSVAAHYEYSPFGETIVATGPEAADNPFRFSTKYWDSESGLYYYVFRYYSPSLGRWLSRDPMEEIGGVNLYGFCMNSSVKNVDYLGLVDASTWRVIWAAAFAVVASQVDEMMAKCDGACVKASTCQTCCNVATGVGIAADVVVAGLAYTEIALTILPRNPILAATLAGITAFLHRDADDGILDDQAACMATCNDNPL